MNASEDQTEPMGESPELTIPRVVPLMDRQTQALNEIREARRRYNEALELRFHAGVAAAHLANEVGLILEQNGLA